MATMENVTKLDLAARNMIAQRELSEAGVSIVWLGERVQGVLRFATFLRQSVYWEVRTEFPLSVTDIVELCSTPYALVERTRYSGLEPCLSSVIRVEGVAGGLTADEVTRPAFLFHIDALEGLKAFCSFLSNLSIVIQQEIFA